MERLGIALLVFLLVIFIGNIVYNESFADCNSPGQMTWTITMDPNSSCTTNKSKRDSSGNHIIVNSDTEVVNGLYADSVKDLGLLSNTTNSISDNQKNTETTKNKKVTKDTKDTKSLIELSLTDLMALIGSTRDSSGNSPRNPRDYNYRYGYGSISIPQPPTPPSPQVYIMSGSPSKSLTYQFPSDLRTHNLDSVIGDYADSQSFGGSSANVQHTTLSTGSPASYQGVQYIRGSPHNLSSNSDNPVVNNSEYIRKDSIPCYACSL